MRFGKLELNMDPARTWSNPFDPEPIDVVAPFIAPSRQVPGRGGPVGLLRYVAVSLPTWAPATLPDAG